MDTRKWVHLSQKTDNFWCHTSNNNTQTHTIICSVYHIVVGSFAYLCEDKTHFRHFSNVVIWKTCLILLRSSPRARSECLICRFLKAKRILNAKRWWSLSDSRRNLRYNSQTDSKLVKSQRNAAYLVFWTVDLYIIIDSSFT